MPCTICPYRAAVGLPTVPNVTAGRSHLRESHKNFPFLRDALITREYRKRRLSLKSVRLKRL